MPPPTLNYEEPPNTTQPIPPHMFRVLSERPTRSVGYMVP